MTVETVAVVLPVPASTLGDHLDVDPFRPLTPSEAKAARRAFSRRQAADARRTDCGCVLTDGEGLHNVGECELPAGHAGEHRVTLGWSRSEYDRRGEWQEFPVPPESAP